MSFLKFLGIFGSGTIAFNFAVINVFSCFDYGCLGRDIKFVRNVRLCFYISFNATAVG